MNNPVIAADDLGTGPAVVLLHPAGFGPGLLQPFAHDLATRYRVVVPHRRGYGSSAGLPLPTSLEDHHDDLVALLQHLGVDRPVIVGASAGATLGLGFVVRHPTLVGAAVVHEPLIGPLGGTLHSLVVGRIERLLDRADEPHETSLFMSNLVGLSGWNQLQERWRCDVETYQIATRNEAALFAHYAVTDDELRALPPTFITTVGERSPDLRFALAATLEDHGLTSRMLPGCCHLPMIEAPDAFTAIVDEAMVLAANRSARGAIA